MNGVSQMDAQEVKELVTYLTILVKGRGEGQVEEAHRLLLRLGTKRFGEVDIHTARRLHAIVDIDHLEALADRLIDLRIESWDDLLQEERPSSEAERGG